MTRRARRSARRAVRPPLRTGQADLRLRRSRAQTMRPSGASLPARARMNRPLVSFRTPSYRPPTLSRACLLAPLVAVLGLSLVMVSTAPAAGDANQASCANAGSPGFRSYLPDCRAYELVTPVSKAGQSQASESIFEDGSHTPHVILSSRGAVEGTGNNDTTNGSAFDLARSSAGWTISPLDPSASLFPSTFNLDVSSTTGRALYLLRTATQPEELETFYLREPDGSFAEVGPDIPPSAATGPPSGATERGNGIVSYSGASRDLTHMLFSLEEIAEQPHRFWPGDTTLPSHGSATYASLYEYVGAGSSRPLLVGVTRGEGSASLISQCGTNLGAGEGAGGARGNSPDTYNAISAGGTRVFFTAAGKSSENCPGSAVAPPVNELFARVDQSRTVAISEPSAADCSMCDTSSPVEGIFQGASEDGSRVFFLSEQKLLSGAAGMNLYEYNFDAEEGKRVVLVSSAVLGVARVSEDGSHVYFVTEGNSLKVYQTATGHTSPIATLAEGDQEVWRVRDERPVEATPDGRFLLFASSADLTPDDTSTVKQLFRYDAQTGAVVRVSVGQNGFNHNGNTESESDQPFFLGGTYLQANTKAAPPPMSISDDGQYLFFNSVNGLTPQANNNQVGTGEELANNVYEYHEGNVYLVSAGQDHSPQVFLIGTDQSGTDVFFETSEQLVPQDTNSGRDIYNARIEGGFPAPVAPAACLGDACQGSLSAPPSLPFANTTTAEGGNLAPPVSKPAVKPLTRAQKLAKALKACRAKHNRHQRAICEAQARRKYGPTHKAKKTSRRVK
jgi:hypothetical protein